MVESNNIEILTEFSRLEQLPRTGVYLLKSGCEELARDGAKALFRIGESKNLVRRKGTHGGSAPKTKWKKPANWTEVYRPWHYIWVATIPGASHLALKMCEHHLFSTFAPVYNFVDESGFEASADSAPEVIRLATAQVPVLRRIVSVQQRGKFDKEAYHRLKWES
jgi:hypothetical protein